MSRYNGPPRHRPQPLALGAGPHQQQPYLQHPLHSAPLPHMSQQAYMHAQQQLQQLQQQHQQQQVPPLQPSHLQANPQTAAALVEFQHAQQAYLAELNRTIEHQILVQQHVEREAAYRMLAIQQQQREQYGLHPALPVSPGYTDPRARGDHERETSTLAQQANPLVASALARRQRQASQQSAPAPAEQHGPPAPRKSPSPPAVILSAPGEPYPDTSSSGSDSGETRPTSPELLVQPPKRDEVKAARRRSHLDALTHTVEHAEERRRRRPVSIAGPGELHPGGGSRYGSLGLEQQQHPALSPRWQQYGAQSAGPGARMNGSAGSARTASDPLCTPRPTHRPGSHSLVSQSSTSSAVTITAASPAPATSTRLGVPPVPGTASAIRQPRGPPTDLDGSQANFATRVRARAIDSLRVRSGKHYGLETVGEAEASSLAANVSSLRIATA
ncbi:hypothetical protein JCM8202_000575 [Rhodotorula sphaerocarpa]